MKSVKEIQEEFAGASALEREALFACYEQDARVSVQKLLVKERRAEEKLKKERARIAAMQVFERQYRAVGPLCGIDEVGRGPLAGPVVACAVILPEDVEILYLNDSKKLTAKKREELAVIIREQAVSFGIGMADCGRIDEINILNATYEAMREAVSHLTVKPSMLLNDAVTIPGISCPQLPIIGGDGKSVSIAAASIVAKVTRDAMMTELDQVYPEYGFASNKGYGTAEHIAALKKYGPCPIHRRSFIGGILGTGEDEEKVTTRKIGSEGENLAADYLTERGLRLVARNYRCPAGEIDLIALDGETLVFVEVKVRSSDQMGSALEAVTPAKQRTIVRVAKHYLTTRRKETAVACRFDVVGIDGETITWIQDAFQA